MKTIIDGQAALTEGLTAIRQEFQVQPAFPPAVEAAANAAIKRPLTDHTDRTAMPFVTLDPASSTDLDQAFAIERRGSELLLHYAIADVPWFVREGDAPKRWARPPPACCPMATVPL
jgi:exoribonuclease R